MKSIAEDKQMPEDQNNVTSGGTPSYNERANRPDAVNDVTSDKVVGYSESDNRPAKPTI